MGDGRIYKSTTDVKVSGVLAGLADSLRIDPTIVRILFVVIAISTAVVPCVIAYLVMDWVMPKDTDREHEI
ncbi:PspC domain-containing protein [Alteribacter lacisalsi]|uniref:PspC domain-containing protein n=1 Tax=Alteribacter lacisalsi TaxID=2045244 RepID=A0A2W0HIP5_9BACI|nr:PspC domain-containing protein [Alteribacter lacisalsi]PYZ96852.1 PspC domain-containing protein [Alteribacter lacisalsi]